MKRLYNSISTYFVLVLFLSPFCLQAFQDVQPPGEPIFPPIGPITIIENLEMVNNLPYCANESFRVATPGLTYNCPNGFFNVFDPSIVAIDINQEFITFTPQTTATIIYTTETMVCPNGVMQEGNQWEFNFFPNLACTSEPVDPIEPVDPEDTYLFTNSFCEGDDLYFFPDPPILKFPCSNGGCQVNLIDVEGVWEPHNGGEVYPPSATAEYIIRYYLPPCAPPECGLGSATEAEIAAYEAALSKALETYSIQSNEYEGKLGLIEINNCEEEEEEEEEEDNEQGITEIFVICLGESVELLSTNQFPQPPAGPVGPDGLSPQSSCTPELVSTSISPEQDFTPTLLGFRVAPSSTTVYTLTSYGNCGGTDGSFREAEIVQSFEVIVEEQAGCATGTGDQTSTEPDTIITICKGEQIELKGWHNTVECPCGASGVGPADCFPFAQPGGTWTVEGQRICDNSCIDITVQPTTTTLYTHQTPPFRCPAIFDPTAPLGPPPPSFPRGETINILVVVEEICDNALTAQNGDASTDPIFTDYTWLRNKVDLVECAADAITVYQSGSYEYIYVQQGENGTLYFENGDIYCHQTANYNCIEAYRLSTIKSQWQCQKPANSFGSNACEIDIFDVRTIPTFDFPPQIQVVASLSWAGLSANSTVEISTYPFEISSNVTIPATSGKIHEVVIGTFRGDVIQTGIEITATADACSDNWFYTIGNCKSTNTTLSPCGCDIDYAPVCGTNGQTYFNACVAAEQDAELFGKDECTALVAPIPAQNRATICQGDTAVFSYPALICGDNANSRTDDFNNPTFHVANEMIYLYPTASTTYRFNEPIDYIDEPYGSYCANKEFQIVVEDCTSNGDCSKYSGTFFYETCEDGNKYQFIKRADGQILDIRTNDGSILTFEDGQKVNFDYDQARFASFCSFVNEAAIITCIEVAVEQSLNNNNEIFTTYPWLTEIIDLTTCEEESVSVYQQGSYAYLYIKTANGAYLYFQDGTLYCTDAPNYDCLKAYSLKEVSNTWACEKDEGCFCIALYDPVCGVDGKTYGNACEAGCAGVEVAFNGTCVPNFPPCPPIDAPVCGTDGKPYSSACEAEQAGVEVAYEGTCAPIPCECANIEMPVCGVDGKTYGNACLAACAGVELAAPEACRVTMSSCFLLETIDLADICGTCIGEIAVYDYLDHTYLVTLPSEDCRDGLTEVRDCETGELFCMNGGIAGFRQCEEFFKKAVKIKTILSQENCGDCICPSVVAPVCGADGKTYNNACQAACAGVEVLQEGACRADCACTQEYAPVCGVDGKTYSNACEAGCAGVEIAAPGACMPTMSCQLLELIDLADICGTCIGELAVYSYLDHTYFVSLPSEECRDGLTTVTDCETGEVFCMNGGIAGFRQCEDFFKKAVKIETILSQENCGDCICPTVIAPVCGVDGKTYTNECEAACAGIEILQEGACRADCICTEEYAPVCGADGKTYDNRCKADCAGVDIIDDNACPPDPTNCICTKEYVPVCGIDGITYGNACEAECAGVEIVAKGECSSCLALATMLLPADLCGTCIDEIAIYEYQDQTYLVSLPSPDCRDGLTTINSCTTGEVFCMNGGIAGFNQCGDFFDKAVKIETILSQKDCGTCICPTVALPVCGADGKTYNNACEAACAGVDVISDGACRTDCICTDEYAPVCGVDGKTYSNRCQADCEGVDIIAEGECLTPCICTADYAPVCGIDGKTYSNACEAECAGVEIASKGECVSCPALAAILFPANLCGTCTEEIALYEYDGQSYIVSLASNTDGKGASCSDGLTTVTSCETGNVFCMEGGIAGFNQCEDFFEKARKTQVLVERGNCEDCICPTVIDPVCGADGKTYTNECEAACVGVEVIRDGTCDCACPFVLAPVCGADGKTYDNECLAICAGVAIVDDSGACNECVCNAVFDPVCGEDGLTYGNACEAACEGVTVLYQGSCADADAPPCHDVEGVDFGDCEAIMGIAIMDGQCVTISGCNNFVVDGIDYTEAFFPTTQICQQTCSPSTPPENTVTPPDNRIFTDYPWLSDIIPTDCTEGKITVYKTGNYEYLYIERENKAILYNADGLFYCQDAPNYDCRKAYQLTEVVTTWACNNQLTACANPLEQDWLKSSLDQECTGAIYAFDYQGEPAIYVSSLCRCLDDADMLFDCNGTFICSVGRIAPDRRCDLNLEENLTTTNLIWSPACDCPCPAFKDPVCGADGISYNSPCLAECAGVTWTAGECEDCICPQVFDPVCGVDGETYSNKCVAACAGVEVVGIGECFDAIAPPCHDLAGVDFGLCAAVMGVAIVNGECTTISGCGNFIMGGTNYEEAFFPTVEICLQSCIEQDGNGTDDGGIIEDFPWLDEVVNFNSCKAKAVSEINVGSYSFIYVYNTKSRGTLYYEDGTFYCQDGPGYDCLSLYGLSSEQIRQTWTCKEGEVFNESEVAEERSKQQATYFKNALTVFPNPTKGRFHIQINTPSKEAQTLSVFDFYGREIQQERVQTNGGGYMVPVDISHLEDGLYMVTLKTKGQEVIHKTIVKTSL